MTFTYRSTLSFIGTDRGLFPSEDDLSQRCASLLEFEEPEIRSDYPSVGVTHRVWTSGSDAFESTVALSGDTLWEFSFKDPPVFTRNPQEYFEENLKGQVTPVTSKLQVNEECGRRTHRAWALSLELPGETGVVPVLFFQKKFDYQFQIFAGVLPSSGELESLFVVFTEIRGVIDLPAHLRCSLDGFFQGPLVVRVHPSELLSMFRGPYSKLEAECPGDDYLVEPD